MSEKPDSQGLLRSIITGSGLSGASKLISKGLGFIFQVFLGNLLGTSGYGLFTVGQTTVSIVSKLSSFGLTNGILRVLPAYSADENYQHLRGLLIIAYGSSLLVAVTVAILLLVLAEPIEDVFFSRSNVATVLRLFAIAIPLTVILSLTKSVLRAEKKIGWFSFLGVFESLSRVVLVIGVLFIGGELSTAIGAYICSTFISALVSLWILYKYSLQDLIGRDSAFAFRQLFRVSLPLYLAGISFLLMTRVDVFAIQYFTESSNVGVYQSAITLAAIVTLPLSSLNTIFAPVISELYEEQNIDELEYIFKISTRWTTGATALISLVVILFREELLNLWGPEFVVASTAVVVLTVGQLMNAITGSVGYMLQMSNNHDYELLNNVFTVLLNLVLNVIFVPEFGILGAGIATAASITINNLLGVAEVHFLLDINPFSVSHLRVIWPLGAGYCFYIISSKIINMWVIDLLVVVVIFMCVFLLFSTTKSDRNIIISYIF